MDRDFLLIVVMVLGAWAIFATGLILRSNGVLPLWSVPQ